MHPVRGELSSSSKMTKSCKAQSRKVPRWVCDRTKTALAGSGRFGGTSWKVKNLKQVDRLGIEDQVGHLLIASFTVRYWLKGHEWRLCEGRDKVFGEKPAGVKA
jgi:ribosomal protein L39E